MTKLRFILVVCIYFALTGGCKKEDEFNGTPEITFVSISDSEVLNFTNAVEITFNYSDRDGDLGSPDPDVNSLRVKDGRLPEYDWYHIPPMTPELQELQIEGSYTLTLNPLFILGNSDEEVTSFTIQLRDRAGNWSNAITTPQVRIIDSE